MICSLSKSWCSRIDSPNFIRKHAIQSVTRARKNVSVRLQIHLEKDGCQILYRLQPDQPYLDLDSLKFPSSSDCEILGSCYGIICLYNKTDVPSITLWNPSIRRKLTVPNVPYHPSKRYHVVFGFGYDPKADDYKLVGISYGSLQTLYLYSTKTNSWSEISLPKAPPFCVMTSSCFVDGIMHWVVKNKLPNTNDSYILTFDLSSHVLGMIPLPNTSWINIYLIIYGGYLAVISGDGQDSLMWVRKDHNVAIWSKAFKATILDINEKYNVLHVKDYNEGLKAYHPFSEVSFTLVSSSDSSSAVFNVDICVETLALLDKETCGRDN